MLRFVTRDVTNRNTVILALLIAGCAAEPKTAPPPPHADYVIVTPAEFVGPLKPLIERRRARVLTLVESGATKEEIRAKLAELRPTYALLVGDADRVPTWVEPSAYSSTKYPAESDLATDFGYADLDGDDREDVMVGRLPADTPEEVAAMVSKILAHESAPPGAWKKKLDFVVGVAGFDAAADAMIEKAFRKFVGGEIPLAYDLEVAYANPNSVHCWPPTEFDDHVIDLFNEGPLVFTYVGHGAPKSFDRLRATGDRVFDIRDVPRLAAKTPPIMVVLACSTAHFDATDDCIGERAMAAPGGPAAFIGGTRVTQPLTNGLLGRAMIRTLFDPKCATIGEALRAARLQIRFGDPDDFEKMMTAFTAMYQGAESIAPMRRDSIRHYNLFGDPAMKVARPALDLALAWRRDGDELVVTGKAAGDRVHLTVEVPRELYKARLRAGGSPDTMRATYRLANDPVLDAKDAPIVAGAFEARFPWFKDRERLVIKASTGDSIGAVALP